MDWKLNEEEQKLVEENIGLVGSIIKKFHGDKDDLFQEGCIGLMSAAHHYVQRKLIMNFSTFAFPRIINQLKHNENSNDNVKRTIELLDNYNYTVTGEHLSREDLAEIFEIDIFQLNAMMMEPELLEPESDVPSPLQILLAKEKIRENFEMQIKEVQKLRAHIRTLTILGK